jgi:hypothetical protein
MRDHTKAFVHVIDWENDVSYYQEHIENAGFDEIGTINEVSMFSNNVGEIISLSYLFTGYLEDPIANAQLYIFYEVIMDILERKSRNVHGLKRGDLIHLNFLCEGPQDGWFFWDGCDITLGTRNENESYRIPENFYIFEEFPPSYWDKYPYDSHYQESVIVSKNLLKTSNLCMYTGKSFSETERRFLDQGNAIYMVEFNDEKYFISMDRMFKEKIMDSDDFEKFYCRSIEIPTNVLNLLKGSGIDTSTIYEKTIHVEHSEEEELAQMLEENMNL